MSKKDEFLSRRDFFKKATKKTLPFLGAIVLGPTISLTTLTSCGCDGCEAACMDNCEGSCSTSCLGRCGWSSSQSTCSDCSSTCSGGCSSSSTSSSCSSCANSCSSSCKGACSSTCEGTATGNNDGISSPDGYVDGFGFVDIGLSINWATSNVGTSSPEGYGDYYAWGEISTKSSFYADTYQYYNSRTDSYTNIGSNISGTQYDAATKKRSNKWRMPKKSEMVELVSKCTWTWKTYSSVKGYQVKGPNGKSIFLPACGSYTGTDKGAKSGIFGQYWTGSFKETTDWYSTAYALIFTSAKHNVEGNSRYDGISIRPVTSSTGSGGNSGCSGNSCSANCQNNSTGNSCSDCASECSGSCNTTCKTGCGRQCYWSCGGSCDKQCEGACITGCQGYNRGGCSGCFGSCYTYCSSTCSSYCFSSCSNMGSHGT